MLPRTVDSETEHMLLARAVETLIMTRSNERVGQRPGQQLEDTLDGKAGEKRLAKSIAQDMQTCTRLMLIGRLRGSAPEPVNGNNAL